MRVWPAFFLAPAEQAIHPVDVGEALHGAKFLVRYNTRLASNRQIGMSPTLGLWAALCLAGGLYASGAGYGGRSLAATLTAFAFYFGVTLLFAARGVADGLGARLGAGGGFLVGSAAFVVYVIYALGTGTAGFARLGAAAAFIFVPLALAASAERKPMGAWQDFLIVAAVWAAVKFGPSHWLWPYPGGRLSYVFTVVLAVTVALAVFVLQRRAGGIGYTLGWGSSWGFFAAASFVAFGCVAIPLGMGMHFIAFDPRWSEWTKLPWMTFGILFFTAWPEEFLFRGLLQNMLARASKSDFAGWWTASLFFGFAHVTNGGFPNWRYMILASIAGFFYGWTWRKTGSIFPAALVHAAVDVTWHFFFRTL